MSDSGRELAAVFEANGALGRALPGFRPRPGQQALALAIAECLDDGTDLVAEAATGTGKTMAYLVPVLLRDARVILSTGTLNLQDQLFRRDLPMALSALGLERKVALLKGRSNYLCLQRLEQHLAADATSSAVTKELVRIRSWSRRTEAGEISELDDIASDSPVWPLVTSTQDNCLGSDCPKLNQCHLVRARRQAQEADVVVVNHHLLFADLALKQTGFGEVLPGASAVVIDEAHQVPDTAMRFFSRGVSAWQIRELARDSLAACASAPGALALLQGPTGELKIALEQVQSEFFELPPRGEFGRLDRVRPTLELLQTRLLALAAALEPLADQTRDLASCADRAQTLGEGLGLFLAGAPGYVRWYQHRRGRFQLQLTPLDVAAPLAELRGQVPGCWIMTSATLAVGGRFSHFTDRLGLDRARELVIDSPFDYPAQTRLWLPGDLPEPRDPGHTEALLQRVAPVLRASRGRAFLLFTSHRALRRAAEWLRAETAFNLLVQEEAPRHVLLERFRTEPDSVLLGAASFWEGVDVPGAALSVVVIDKLPFAAPDDPVLEAILGAVRENGENPFLRVQLPQAVLTLKQGAGRLIRQADDFGVLVLGDPRLMTKSYGRLFLSSLPPMTRVKGVEAVIEFLHARLAS
ncbi:ATP-dependent DNA helicase [Wenzhouxiangella limi]|uniref:DNA 5'-3' helicase n=1 Tax=Wenzhouxiangella limi TaxID=2707351 RepID=A0A845UZC9_9GAMM|nr:ATP-dependent DNA helicase [Wenzhouxiangella limi]NDY96098.1 ATP-dependent DNA helicase [Wenzhouxiangella limi]